MSDWVTITPFIPPAPGTNLQSNSGTWFLWCLAFVQEGYGLYYSGPSAIESWKACPEKFPGELPPQGVESIVWWDWDLLGHVAVMRGDGSIVTSPTKSRWQDSQGTVTYPSLDAFNQAHEGLTYLGWSTCLGYSETRVMYKAVKPAPNNKRKKNKMKFTADLNGNMYCHTEFGFKQVVDITLLELLHRYAANEWNTYQGAPFHRAEIDRIEAFVESIRDAYFKKLGLPHA